MGIMEARSPRQIKDRIRDLYRTALVANWRVWPLAQVRFLSSQYSLTKLARFLAHQFPIHASTIPRAILTSLWCLLDIIPLYT